MKNYYSYTAQELCEKAKLPVRCMESSEAVFRALAEEMLQLIRKHNAEGKRSVIICPVGPVGHYPFFVEAVNRERLSLKNCWFFNMDEYLEDENTWVAKEHMLSFRGFMDREVYSKIDPELVVPENQRIFPDPEKPHALTQLIESMGGADLCIGGIGINGHLAFNEAQGELSPEAFATLTTRVLKISPETRTSNAIGDLGGAIEDMPEYAVTIGINEILNSKKIRLGVFRPWHRAVVRRAACGPVTADFPVTLTQHHTDAAILVNDVAAEKAI